MAGDIRFVATPFHNSGISSVPLVLIPINHNRTETKAFPQINSFGEVRSPLMTRDKYVNPRDSTQFKKINPQRTRELVPIRRFDYNPNDQKYQSQSAFNRRDGWGAQGEKQSPAIQALGLLAFLFFLHLIQSSLQNNRLLLSHSLVPANGTPVGNNFALGRSGRVRRRRGLQEFHKILRIHPNPSESRANIVR